MDRFIQSDLLDFSFPFKSDDFVLGHIIDPQARPHSSTIQELFKVLAPSISFFVSFLTANLFYVLSLMLLALMVRKGVNLANRLKAGSKFITKLKAYKVMLISYALMTFFVIQLLSNNLSTEKVIVDVSDLMHNEETIKSTKRKACFMGLNNFELSLAIYLRF